jgi:hypothetical protein
MTSQKSIYQCIWGAALLLMGIAVLFRVPQVMPRIVTLDRFAGMEGVIRFCFYFIAVILIGGGAKKIYDNYPVLLGREPDGK